MPISSANQSLLAEASASTQAIESHVWIDKSALEMFKPGTQVGGMGQVFRGKIQISLQGGYYPTWNPNGKELFSRVRIQNSMRCL
jgi:hypothetical protein